MRIIVVCVTYFFAFSVANIAASESVRHDGELYSTQGDGIHKYQYRDVNGYISTSSTEKMNEDGSKSLIDDRKTEDKRGDKTFITRTTEETIINPQTSSIIKVIYTRVVEEIDANNPNKSTYETYQTESYPNSKTSNLCGNISPSSTIFESKPLIPLGGLKSHLPENEVDFINDHQITTAATSHGYEDTSEQAGVISGANSPQSASEAENSELNLEESMNSANLPQYTPGRERPQSYLDQYDQVPRPEARSRSMAISQQTDRISEANFPQYTPGQEHLQSYPAQYDQVPWPEALSRNRLAPQVPSHEAPFRTGPPS